MKALRDSNADVTVLALRIERNSRFGSVCFRIGMKSLGVACKILVAVLAYRSLPLDGGMRAHRSM